MVMDTIDITGMKQAIKNIAIKLNEPVMVLGQFGAGKTAGAEQVVDELDSVEALDALFGEDRNTFVGAMMADVRLGQYESVDLRGFPGVSKLTGLTTWHAPSTMPFIGNDAFPDDKLILLFLDELTSATPPVFAVAYQLINERRVGEHVLKPNVRICAAGNRDVDKGVVNRMPMPLNNRLTFFEAGVTVEAWTDWASNAMIELLPGEFIKVPPVLIAFLNFRKNLLNTYDPAKFERVVATPRTWVKAAKYYASDIDLELKVSAMKGAVGAGPTAEFWGFHDIWQKVTPIKSILANPDGIAIPEEASMQYATAVSVSGHMNQKTMEPLYTFITRMPAEFTVLAMHLATKRDEKLFGTKQFIDFGKRYRAVFNAG